jgi:hypothetical protein
VEAGQRVQGEARSNVEEVNHCGLGDCGLTIADVFDCGF